MGAFTMSFEAMYRSYIESQMREMMGGARNQDVSPENRKLNRVLRDLDINILWKYLSSSYFSTFSIPQLSNVSLRLGNMGWFSSKKEHQEILTQIQNSSVKENQKEDQNITCNPKIIIRIDEFEDDEKVTSETLLTALDDQEVVDYNETIEKDDAADLCEYELEESSSGKRGDSFDSPSALGKNSRSNSLLLLNESLSEAGEAIKNMDKDDNEAMDEVQVQAIKFLAIVASKI